MRICTFPCLLFLLHMTSFIHLFCVGNKVDNPYAILNFKEFSFL